MSCGININVTWNIPNHIILETQTCSSTKQVHYSLHIHFWFFSYVFFRNNSILSNHAHIVINTSLALGAGLWTLCHFHAKFTLGHLKE
jgi:hypothetical protein